MSRRTCRDGYSKPKWVSTKAPRQQPAAWPRPSFYQMRLHLANVRRALKARRQAKGMS